MTSEKVWSRFKGKSQDGIVLKLRIQDIPRTWIDDAIELMIKYYVKEEVVHKATGINEDPESFSKYKAFLAKSIKDPSYSTVICCTDDDQLKDIMGVSMLSIIDKNYKNSDWKFLQGHGTAPLKKLDRVCMECTDALDPIKEYSLDKFYEDRGLFVIPEYRGFGIAEQFFKVRRIMCNAHGVPMTGAWMTAHGTQIAAARDGWETVKELSYDCLGEKIEMSFTDGPPTMKLMIARPDTSDAKN